jgi:ATP-dependent Lon protease
VVFPGMVAPLFVGRKQSVNALNNVMTGEKKIFLISQKDSEIDNPKIENLYKLGTVAKILQLLKLPDGTIKVLVEGVDRASLKSLNSSKDFLTANISIINKKIKVNTKIKALTKIVLEQFEEYVKVNKKLPSDLTNNLKSLIDPNKISDLVSVNLSINLEQKQEILELLDIEVRLDKIYSYLVAEIDSFQVEKKIKGRVKRQMEKNSKRILS